LLLQKHGLVYCIEELGNHYGTIPLRGTVVNVYVSVQKGEGGTDNPQQLNNLSTPASTTTYELLDVNAARPVTYQDLQTQHNYYNVDNPSNIKTTNPYMNT